MNDAKRETVTVARAIEICERRKALTLYIGAGGLGGLGLFGAGDLASWMFQRVPPIMSALFYSGILLGGFCLGRAYSGYEYRATSLKRQIDDGGKLDDTILADEVSPREAKAFYGASMVLVTLAGIILLLTAWWSVNYDDPASSTQSAQSIQSPAPRVLPTAPSTAPPASPTAPPAPSCKQFTG
jgi:hypothetical protein